MHVGPYRDCWFENGDSTYTDMETHFISIQCVAWSDIIMKAVRVESLQVSKLLVAV